MPEKENKTEVKTKRKAVKLKTIKLGPNKYAHVYVYPPQKKGR
jgi:hypothetical protein